MPGANPPFSASAKATIAKAVSRILAEPEDFTDVKQPGRPRDAGGVGSGQYPDMLYSETVDNGEGWDLPLLQELLPGET